MEKNSLILALLKCKGWGPKKVLDFVTYNDFCYEKCIDGLRDVFDDYDLSIFQNELIAADLTIKKNLEEGVKTISLLDKDFPKKLYWKNDISCFLYYIGDISLLSKKIITIIGTRKPECNFVEAGAIVTKFLSNEGYVIASGLAIGCDSVAHQATLDCGGKTIAILPSPCNRIVPASNAELAKSIVNNGGLLISEYGTDDIVTKYNFPQRDRIQSLLASAVVVIECSETSGTMIAVRKSIKDGKRVVALKGNNISEITEYIDPKNENELMEFANSIL